MQDITLFRNILQLSLYIEMFLSIVKRQFAFSVIEKIENDIRSVKPRINELTGRIRQIDSITGGISPEQTEAKLRYKKELKLRESRHKSLNDEKLRTMKICLTWSWQVYQWIIHQGVKLVYY